MLGRMKAELLDVPGLVRRVRRAVDLSQRDLADELGVAQATVARWETGEGEPSLAVFQHLLALADWGLGVVDAAGAAVQPMGSGACRDQGNRRFPAHLDVEDAELPSSMERRPRAPRRRHRDAARLRAGGVPGDHPTPAALVEERRRVVAARGADRIAAMAARRRAPEPEPPCFCADGCFLVPGCLPQCDCACEPRHGRITDL